MISQPCEPVLMFKSFLSVGEFASRYNIRHMLTFDMRRSQMPDESIHEGILG